jgi:hypothetical protein
MAPPIHAALSHALRVVGGALAETVTARRCWLTPGRPRIDRAWFRGMKLNTSNCFHVAFNLKMRRYMREDAEVCELAALVSDRGAAAQKLHADTKMQPPGQDHVVLLTCFLALQDVSPAMGPTCISPRQGER